MLKEYSGLEEAESDNSIGGKHYSPNTVPYNYEVITQIILLTHNQHTEIEINISNLNTKSY